jgi:SPP1 family predicted phage head-tail adaptor
MSSDNLRAQSLRRRIRVERKVATRDDIGGEEYSFTLRAELYANVRYLKGQESLLSQEMTATEQYEFIIRYRTDIDMTDRIVWKGNNYDIQSIAEQGRNVALRIIAKRPGAEAVQ